MSPVDFSRLGGTKLGEIPPPPVAPEGTYYGVIRAWKWAESRWKNKESGQSEAQVHFTVKPTGFGDNIPDEARVGINLANNIHVAEVGVGTEAQVYYMQEFLKSLGINVVGKTLDSALPETLNAQVKFDLVHRDGDRGTIVNVRKLRSAQD